MNKLPKISIIIPVFNTGKYLKKCLDSLVYQTYKNLEIICVDDGSTDDSGSIINEYKNRDTRIIPLEQEHKGAGAARNLGIRKASGEYISFIDSDDWVFLTLYRTFVDYLAQTDKELDIYMFNVSAYEKGKNDVLPKTFFDMSDWNNPQNKYSIHTFDECMRPFSRNLSAANKIYSKAFLEKYNISFPESLKYEDQYFSIRAFLNAETIMINDNIFYRYRNMIESSSTLEITPKVFDIFKIVDLVEGEIYTLNCYEPYKYALFQYKFNTYTSHYKYCPEDLRRKYFDEMKHRLLAGEKQSLDSRIYTRLRNYTIFEKVKECSFEEFNEYFFKHTAP